MTVATKTIPKGYKQTEIGVIPADWDVKRLGDIGDSIIGLTYAPSDVSYSGKLVHRSSNVQNSRLSYKDNVYVNKEINEKLILRENDILICVRNGSRDLIGKSAIISGKSIGETFGAFMSVYRTSECQVYIYYLILSDVIQKQINQALGATINQITNKTLNDFLIPYPQELDEQVRISAALSDVDSLIEKTETLIEKKKKIKQGMMQTLLTGKLRLPGFSDKWKTRKLSSLGMFRGGNGFPTQHQGSREGSYPFYKVSDMNNEGNSTFMFDANHWISEKVCQRIGANTFPANTIVFAKIGAAIFLERKKILSQESCMDNNMMGFILNETQARPRFIHYLFHNIKLGNLVSATALPSLNGKEIGELSFDVPDPEEQTAIATILSDMDTEIEKLESELTKWRDMKQGMMQTLLTGKIRLIK